MLKVAAVALVLATTACTSTRLVPRSELEALATLPSGDAVVVKTTSVWRSRIDPSSDVRFRDRNGAWTAWLHASDLSVGEGWVYKQTPLYPPPYFPRAGWQWSQIADAEVRDLSGSKTFGAIVGTTALVIALLPVALVARGAPSFGHAGGGGGGGAGSSGGSGGGGGGALLGHVGGGGGGAELDPPGTWPATLDTAGRPAHRLFGAGARRRTAIQLAASAEVGVDSQRARTILDGGFATLRLGQIYELGLGGMHVAARGADGDWWNGGLLLVRMGVHLPLDAAHRVAIPLSLDVGGGGGEALGVAMRLRTGLSVRVSDRAAITVTPVAPTLLNWKHGVDAMALRKWSFTTSLELGLAF